MSPVPPFAPPEYCKYLDTMTQKVVQGCTTVPVKTQDTMPLRHYDAL